MGELRYHELTVDTNEAGSGIGWNQSWGNMPALCCYDTCISLEMTLKSTRGSHAALFVCCPERALILRDSVSTVEHGPCQENSAFVWKTK